MKKFVLSVGLWLCDICMIDNDVSKIKCVVCEILKFGVKFRVLLLKYVVNFD